MDQQEDSKMQTSPVYSPNNIQIQSWKDLDDQFMNIKTDDIEYPRMQRNSIHDLQTFKNGLVESANDLTKSIIQNNNAKNNKKVDNMIDYYSLQLALECKKSNISEEAQDDLYKGQDKKIIKIQSRRKYKIKLKRAIYRKNVILELCDTEERYVEDLKLIIQTVLQPIRKDEILDFEEQKKVFNNLEQILILNQDFLRQLKEKLIDFNTKPYTTIGELTCKFVHFFKIYYDYFQNFSVETVEAFRNDPDLQEFDEFLKQLEATDVFRGLNLEAFLVKPVQRLPKYVLLYKDLVKHTDQDHPDYQNLNKALEGFRSVMTNINQKINKQVKNYKMFELQRTFGDPNKISILDATREFLAEETLTILNKHENEKSVIVYFLSDMLLISERQEGKEKLFKLIELNESSYCKNHPDFSNYTDLFTVYGHTKNETFICGSKENKQKVISMIETDIIKELATKNRRKRVISNDLLAQRWIQVDTIATEERQSFFSNYTVYIVEISIKKYKHRIFVRYSEMVELEQMSKKEFPHFEIPHLPTMTFSWINKTKIIENRKILIEEFLQVFLQSQQVRSNPDNWLRKLDLPQHFYMLGEIECAESEENEGPPELSKIINMEKSIQTEKSLQHDRMSLNLNNISRSTAARTTKSQTQTPTLLDVDNSSSFSSSHILRITKQELCNSRASSGRMNSLNLQSTKFRLPEIFKKVTINLMDGSEIPIEINETSRASEIVEMMAKIINLHTFLDFKLMLCDYEKRTLRVIDDDEIVMKIAKQISDDEKSGLETFLTKISGLFQSKNKHYRQIILKKYLYLPQINEEMDYKNDPIRLKLLCYQIFNDMWHGVFNLNVKEYQLFATFYLYICHNKIQANINSKVNFPVPLLRDIIPSKIYFQHSEKVWVDAIFSNLKRIRQDINKIQKEKQKAILEVELYNEQIEESIQENNIAQMILMKQLHMNTLYGVTFYSVTTSRHTIDTTKQMIFQNNQKREQFMMTLPREVFLGFSMKQLLILKSSGSGSLPFALMPIYPYEMETIQDIQYYPDSIAFTVSIQNQQVRLSFYSNYVFEMQKILKEYQEIRLLQEKYTFLSMNNQ